MFVSALTKHVDQCVLFGFLCKWTGFSQVHIFSVGKGTQLAFLYTLFLSAVDVLEIGDEILRVSKFPDVLTAVCIEYNFNQKCYKQGFLYNILVSDFDRLTDCGLWASIKSFKWFS